MKRNIQGVLAAIVLGSLMACGTIAHAQDSTNTPPAGARPPRGARGGPQAILDKLDLTADQKEKIKPILADQREKMTALRDDTSIAQADRRPKMKEIMDATDAKLKVILTADQYTKYLDLRKTMMNGRRGAGGGAGTNAPPQN